MKFIHLINKGSESTLHFLNKIYGIPNSYSTLLSHDYFSVRAWKVSFILSTIYVTIALILVIDENSFSIEKAIIPASITIFFTIILLFIWMKLKNTVLAKTSSNNIGSSEIALIYSVSISFLGFYSSYLGYFPSVIPFVIIPSFTIWLHGIKGLWVLAYSLILLTVIGTFSAILVSLANNSLSGEPFNNSVGIVAISILLVLTLSKRNKYIAMISRYLILPIIFISTFLLLLLGGDGSDILTLVAMIFFICILVSYIAVNSFADLVSSNISRYLFYKLIIEKSIKRITRAIFVDSVTAIILILFTIGNIFIIAKCTTWTWQYVIPQSAGFQYLAERVLYSIQLIFSISPKPDNEVLALYFIYITAIIPTLLHFSLIIFEAGILIFDNVFNLFDFDKKTLNIMATKIINNGPKKPKVFLSYALEDSSIVEYIFNKLLEYEIDVWKDDKSLKIGELWEYRIDTAIKESDFAIVFLSSKSVNKIGYVQYEFRKIIKASKYRPEHIPFTLPVKLDECSIPSKFKSYQWRELNITSINHFVSELASEIHQHFSLIVKYNS
jgi:hypothetical protein